MQFIDHLTLKILLTIFLTHSTHTQPPMSDKPNKLLNKENCPKIYPKKFIGYVPFANKSAGMYTQVLSDEGVEMTLEQCVQKCCNDEICNIVFMYSSQETGMDCFKVQCESNEKCRPVYRESERFRLYASMVLVRPVTPQSSWTEYLPDNMEIMDSPVYDGMLTPVNDSPSGSLVPKSGTPCTSNTGCQENEICDLSRLRCECKPGFERESDEFDRDDAGFEARRRLETTGRGLDGAAHVYEREGETRRGGGACVLVMDDGSDFVSSFARAHTMNSDTADDAIGRASILSPIYAEGNLNPLRLSQPLSNINPLENFGLKTLGKKFERKNNLDSESVLNPSLPSGLNPLLPGGQDESSKVLTVSVKSKVVKLPENEVQLSSYVVPVQKDEPYQYKWTLLSSPEGGAETTMIDQNKAVLKLRKLIRGVYVFRVNITSRVGSGTATGNVTVLPADHINQPPKAIINPSTLTVKLPNTVAVLDGTPSTDDDKIISYRWELQQGPLEYKPPTLMNVALLKLDSLNITGNYTFKLSVEDSNHEINSTTANITVIKVPDYPPEANAGPDKIIYLPHNNVTLNGNLSTDDHGLVSYEWTLRESNQHKPVDMQKSKTPYLQLSNLELGTYTFTLKVTDGSNQTSTSDVHVFVKAPTHEAPHAHGGGNYSVTLPLNWVALDASGSSKNVINYTWTQRDGPSTLTFVPIDISADAKSTSSASTASSAHPKINATNLTKGMYRVELTVRDVNDNTARDVVVITVLQNGNQAPKANAGDNMILYLPQNYMVLNGSKSSDDLRIVSYLWTREPTSNAMGDVIMNSDKEPVMILTNIVVGRYMFKLTVTDEQGLHSEDTISVIVKPDPLSFALVSLSLNIQVSKLSQSQVDTLLGKLNLVFPSGSSVKIRTLSILPDSNLARLELYVNGTHGPEPSRATIGILREKLALNPALLDLDVVSLRTHRCENDCSGHGKCLEDSRICLCESFWTRNLWTHVTSDPLLIDDNCDWSLLYVTLVLGASLSLLLATCVCLLRDRNFCSGSSGGKSSYRRRNYKYDKVKSRKNGAVRLSELRVSSEESEEEIEFERDRDRVKLLNGGGKREMKT